MYFFEGVVSYLSASDALFFTAVALNMKKSAAGAACDKIAINLAAAEAIL
jgi:hypothetical protein